jgi:hypothetical protein
MNDELDDQLLRDSGISHGETERVTPSYVGLQQEDRKLPTPGQLRAATSSDGIMPFMVNFTASAAKADTEASNFDAAPATRDFIKAASFLRK